MDDNRSFEEFSNRVEENTLGETMNYDLSEDALMFEMANLLPCRT